MESTTHFPAPFPDETAHLAWCARCGCALTLVYVGRAFGVDEYRCDRRVSSGNPIPFSSAWTTCGQTILVPVPGFDVDAKDRERAALAEAHRRSGYLMSVGAGPRLIAEVALVRERETIGGVA